MSIKRDRVDTVIFASQEEAKAGMETFNSALRHILSFTKQELEVMPQWKAGVRATRGKKNTTDKGKS